VSEREISPETLNAAFGRLQQDVARRVQAPPVSALVRKSRTRTRRRLALAATASIAAALATIFLLLPDDDVNPAPVKPASVELSAPLVDGEPAGRPPGPDVATGGEVAVEVTVTNSGERPLESVGGHGLTCATTRLDPGESTTCSTGLAPELGQHRFELGVTAKYSDDETISDRLTVFYRGTPAPHASVAISSPTINQQPVGAGRRPTVPTDLPAVVGVRIANDGDLPLANLSGGVTDGGPVLSCDSTGLGRGADTTCSVTVGVDVGPGELVIRVTATDPAGDAVRDTVNVHYNGAPPEPPADAFLTADDANTVLGSWTGDTFRTAGIAPSALEFPDSCSPDPLPNASDDVLVDGENAAITTTIAILPTAGDAEQSAADLIGQVSACVEARPARDQVFNGVPTTSATGTAEAFGALVGVGQTAAQYEYIVVARDGTAVGVSTFAVYAQDTLSDAVLDELAGRVLDRLSAAS